jgi:hypothetical protein
LARIRIISATEISRISIGPQRHWVNIAGGVWAIVVWLCGVWAIVDRVGSQRAPGNHTNLVYVWTFLLAAAIVWTGLGVLAFLLALWPVLATEFLTISPEALKIEDKLLRLGWTREFTVDNIRNVRVDIRKSIHKGHEFTHRTLAFDYVTRIFRLRTHLSERDAYQVMDALVDIIGTKTQVESTAGNPIFYADSEGWMTAFESEDALGRHLEQNDVELEPHVCWDSTGARLRLSWDGQRVVAAKMDAQDMNGLVEALARYAALERVAVPNSLALADGANPASIWLAIAAKSPHQKSLWTRDFHLWSL